jgi:hypothetical protein
MKHVTVGFGEVGQAIHSIVGGEAHDPFKSKIAFGKFHVMHVCIPFTKKFKAQVKEYQARFGPKLTIVHSSVPIGTCDELGVVHSPIRGVHPNLERGIRTFVKYFGGKDAKKAAKIFKKLGLETFVTPLARNTEAGKLWDTTQYGVFILLNKEIKKFCDRNKLDFDLVYRHFNESYNTGYTKLGRSEVVRPSLRYIPGKIGGHCVLPNAKLLKSPFAKLLDTKN